MAIYTTSHVAQAKVLTPKHATGHKPQYSVYLSALRAYFSKILMLSFQLHRDLPITQSSRILYAFLLTTILATCPAHHILLDFSPQPMGDPIQTTALHPF